MVLPLLTACYLSWTSGGQFAEPLLGIAATFTVDNNANIWSMPWPALLPGAIMLLLDVAGAITSLNSVYSVGFKAGFMLLLATGVALLPCSGPTALLLLAVPTALLTPFLLMRMHRALSLPLYMLLLAWSLAAPYVWPLTAN